MTEPIPAGYPFTTRGGAAIVFLALFGLVPWIGWLWWVAAQAYVVPIVRRSAGEDTNASAMPRLSEIARDRRFLGDWLRALAVALMAMWPVWSILGMRELAAVAPESKSFTEPLLPVMVLVAFLFPWYPTFLASLARTDSLLRAFVPGVVKRTSRAARGRLQSAIVVASLSVVFVPILAGVLGGLGWGRGIIVRAVMVYLHFLIAHLTGQALRGVPLHDQGRAE